MSRLTEIDILRAAAIVLILLAHLPAYLELQAVASLEIYSVTIGLSLFLFISGYCAAMQHPDLSTWGKAAQFAKKRFLRIYPLYVPALLLFILCFHCLGIYHKVDFTPVGWKTLIHLLAAQEILSPRVAPLFTLWFIGIIWMYYVVYALVARFTIGIPQTLVLALGFFGLCLGVRHQMGLFGNRFFMYYAPFIGGIVAAKAAWIESCRRQPVVVSLLFLASAISALYLWPLKDVVYDRAGEHWLESTEGEICRVILSLSSALVAVYLACVVARTIPRWVEKMVVFGSFASYAVYLYHRPFFAVLSSSMKHVLGVPLAVRCVILIVLGIPSLFVGCYYIQRLERCGVGRTARPAFGVHAGTGGSI